MKLEVESAKAGLHLHIKKIKIITVEKIYGADDEDIKIVKRVC